MLPGCNIGSSGEAVIDVSELYSWVNLKYSSNAWALSKNLQIQLNYVLHMAFRTLLKYHLTDPSVITIEKIDQASS